MITIRTNPVKTLRLSLLVIIAWSLTLPYALADDTKLLEQRKQYIAAKKSLSAGHLKAFHKMADGLKDYPLYPYLRYDYLSRRLWKVENAEIIGFLKNYGDLPKAKDLRRAWLKLLIKRGHWQTYVDNYSPQKDKVLQCYQLIARIKTKNEVYLLEDIRTLWLTGESLPHSLSA